MRHIVFLILSIPVGLAGAGLIWLWWRSPIPTFHVFTPILQGMIVGLAMMWLAARLKINWKLVRIAVGALAGIWSILALLQFQYRSAAHDYLDQRRRAVHALMIQSDAVPERRVSAAQLYDREVLQPATGLTGPVGYMRLQEKRARWRWGLRGVEWILVASVAGALSYAGTTRLSEVN